MDVKNKFHLEVQYKNKFTCTKQLAAGRAAVLYIIVFSTVQI